MTEKQKVTALSARSSGSAQRVLSAGTRWKLAGIAVVIFLSLFFTLSAAFSLLGREPRLGVVLPAPLVHTQESPEIIHPFPDTGEVQFRLP
jgi:hypothetical protein